MPSPRGSWGAAVAAQAGSLGLARELEPSELPQRAPERGSWAPPEVAPAGVGLAGAPERPASRLPPRLCWEARLGGPPPCVPAPWSAIGDGKVRVMNITSQGNSTLIRWGIFPAGSDSAMSNATAMGIIYRLTQHHVQLPENLGSYQLIEWNVQPLPRR